MQSRDQIKTFWVKSCSQLGNLNKKNVSSYHLMKTIQKGIFYNRWLRYDMVVLKIKQW